MADAESRFLDALYRGVTDDGEFRHALELAREIFACQGAAVVSVDARSPAADLGFAAGVFAEYGRLYLEQFIAIDPAPAIFARLASGTASSTDRMFDEAQLRQIPFFTEFFRPIGLIETLGGNLHSGEGRFSLIGFQRGKDRRQFDDDDIATLERLMPHTTRALQLRRAFLRVEALASGLQAAVDRLPAGAVLLDRDGTGLFANAAMRAIAQRGDGFSLDRAGRPLPANMEVRKRFEALLRDVAAGGAGGILVVPRVTGAGDYIALISPSPPALSIATWERRGTAGALVLVHDPQARTLNAVEILERGLHLPKGSARVVAALATDSDLKSFAEREGVTIHTARFHLHTAFGRTGAKTQAELVRLAVRLLRDFALSSGEGDPPGSP